MLQRQTFRILPEFPVRLASTNANGSPAYNFYNRNPRNLEKMRIAYKPVGYHLEKPGRSYWHNLEVKSSKRYITVSVVHYLNGPVVEASTQEWAIKKQLYRTNDTTSYINLGRILSQRCLEAGITEMNCNLKPNPGGKLEKFLENFTNGGISLKEGERYKASRPWDEQREEKPWEVIE